MSDKLVDKINEGWLLALCFVPFLISASICNNAIYWCVLVLIWLIPFVLFLFRDGSILENTILKRYEVSIGVVYLLAIQYSIVSFLIICYNIFDFKHIFVFDGGTDTVTLLYTLLGSGCYLLLNYFVIRGFVFTRKEEPTPFCCPVVSEEELDEDAVCVLRAIDEYEEVLVQHKLEREKLADIHVPVPSAVSEENKAPFVSYLNDLTNAPKEHPEFAGLEQFVLAIADNSQLVDLGDCVIENLGKISLDGWDYAKGLKDVMLETKSGVLDYIKHPDHETTSCLLCNIEKCINHDIGSGFFRSKFSHTPSSEKLSLMLKQLGKDAGKGVMETFTDHDAIHNLGQDFIENLHDHVDELATSFSTDIDVDVWNPDFNCDAHFPLISTSIEAFRLGSKLVDGDVDMESAFKKSGLKVGMTTGGAYLGSVLGTLIFPGLGTMVGSMLGGWLGRKQAKEINIAELKELQEEYNEQIGELNKQIETFKQNIVRYQQETSEGISRIAKHESDVFENLKTQTHIDACSVDSIISSVTIVVSDYIRDFVKEVERDTDRSMIKHLRTYLPSDEQLRLYPKESLMLVLASQKYIRENFKEDVYYDSSLMSEVCLTTIITKLAMVKSLQAMWYNTVYSNYKNAISTILTQSNGEIEKYVSKVDTEKRAIDTVVADVEHVKKKVEAEAKTL